MDSTPSPSSDSNYWWESLLEVIRKTIAWWCHQTFENKKFVDITQRYLAFFYFSKFPMSTFAVLEVIYGNIFNARLSKQALKKEATTKIGNPTAHEIPKCQMIKVSKKISLWLTSEAITRCHNFRTSRRFWSNIFRKSPYFIKRVCNMTDLTTFRPRVIR